MSTGGIFRPRLCGWGVREGCLGCVHVAQMEWMLEVWPPQGVLMNGISVLYLMICDCLGGAIVSQVVAKVMLGFCYGNPNCCYGVARL